MPTTTPPPVEPLYTYQDLVARFQVHYSTVWRWFRRRKKFKPSAGTVRIAESTLQQFITDSNTADEKKRKRS